MAASWLFAGLGKSGWPMQNETMERPFASRSATSWSTTKAFSVPRAPDRFDMGSMMGSSIQLSDGIYRRRAPSETLPARSVPRSRQSSKTHPCTGLTRCMSKVPVEPATRMPSSPPLRSLEQRADAAEPLRALPDEPLDSFEEVRRREMRFVEHLVDRASRAPPVVPVGGQRVLARDI